MRQFGISGALAASALTLAATPANASVEFVIDGTAASGEVIEFSYAIRDTIVGTVTFSGGTLDFAKLDADADVDYRNLGFPRVFYVLHYSSSCTLGVDLPCDEFTGSTADSFSFQTPRLPSAHNGNFLLDPDPAALPPLHLRSGTWVSYSTLTFAFTATGPDPVSYSFSGYNSAPEPSTWALMLGGFGFAGAALRRGRRLAVASQPEDGR